MTVIRLDRSGTGTMAVLALSSLLAGCDGWFNYDDGDSKVSAHVSARQNDNSGALGIVAPGGRLLSDRGGDLLIPFTGVLDPASVSTAVRVVDGSRGNQPMAVTAVAEGDRIRVRSESAAGFRPGASLRVEIAGMPSLRALRGLDGGALQRTVGVTVDVRTARRGDGQPPLLTRTDPVQGAVAMDPDAPIVLRFSQRMDRDHLTHDSLAPDAAGMFLLLADGASVPFRCIPDRRRRSVTLMPYEGLPGDARIEVVIDPALRDANGVPLHAEATTRLEFTTASAKAETPLRIIEAFEDDRLQDPLATTVLWNDPTIPGVLAGVLEPRVIETSENGRRRPYATAADGGTLRLSLSVDVLGTEPRLLQSIALMGAAGASDGRLLDPRVRTRTNRGDVAATWTESQWSPGEVRAVGPESEFVLKLDPPVAWEGKGSMLLELNWVAAVGRVIFRGRADADGGLAQQLADGSLRDLAIRPTLRITAIGLRAVATSKWIDSGRDHPLWLAPEIRPLLDREAVRFEFQGAPPAPDGHGRILEHHLVWTEDPGSLAGMRFVRFRVVFDVDAPLEARFIDDLALPFYDR